MKTKTILSTSLSLFITAQAWGHDDHIHTSENIQATTNIFEKDHTTNNGEKTKLLGSGYRLLHEEQIFVKLESDRLNSIPKKTKQSEPKTTVPFRVFEDKLELEWDNEFLYVGSNGMPDHQMMVGITAWQQQVPLPQQYFGSNAWQIPLKPTPSPNPMSAKAHFFRGAIALAANGVPIFNPIKNNGRTDTLLAGELDKWGGHCGRGDDYHYHVAPIHLEDRIGRGKPIAYALDGYPIYGYFEPDGSLAKGLDWLNGHKDSFGNYHYHATKDYPYINGGFYGKVVEKDGQVDPQPRAQAVRPSLPGLKGARITGFESADSKNFKVSYEVFGKKKEVNYQIGEEGAVTFNFVDSAGTKTETYEPKKSVGGPRLESKKMKGMQANKKPGGQGKGPREGEARKPWIVAHAKELDINGDGVVSTKEVNAEVDNAFTGFDQNNDGFLSDNETQSRGAGPKSPMGGFIKGHASEFDRNGDGLISKNEASLLFLRFVRQVDQNNDGELSKKELVEAESRPKGDKKKEKKDGKGKGKKEPKKTNKKNK